MAGAFSGHLLHALDNAPAQSSSPTVVTSGTMSFDARAHGTPAPSFPPFSSPSSVPHTLLGFTPFSEERTTAKQIATLQAKLNKKLGPEYISQRPGPGGGPKLTYAEGWKIINLANEVFGFNGWSSNIVSIATDFIDYSEESKKFNVGVTAIVRVTLRDGAYHEDVGYGMLENGKSKAAALDKCKKEAITDALKRTLRNFGNLLGNCLYDKSYAQEVVKIKVPPAKLDKNDLYRRPEFEERLPDPPAPARPCHTAVPDPPSTRHEEPRIKEEHDVNRPETPITYVPRHLRQEKTTVAQSAQVQIPGRVLPHQRVSDTVEAPVDRGLPPTDVSKPNGLRTPVQTPLRANRPPPPRPPLPRVVVTSPLVQLASAPERSVSFSEPMPILPHTGCTDDVVHNTGQAHDSRNAADDDDDAFPLSTQDDAFLATVDLGEGDLGRPIDFDEGVGGVSVMDGSGLEPEPEPDSMARLPAVPPLPEPRVCSRAGRGSSTGSHPSAGPSKANVQTEVQVHPAAGPPSTITNTEPNAGASGSHKGGASSIASTSSTPVHDTRRHRPAMTSTGVFHFPPGVKPPGPHTPKPVSPACVRTTFNAPQSAGPTNALKRSADVMQAGSGSSTRPPMQGMGLAQRQQQQQHHAIARRPSDTDGAGHDPKRLKH